MRVALLWIVMLFGLSEALDWLKQVELPMPVLIVGGLVLAIASNYDKRESFPLWPESPPKAPPAAAPTVAAPPTVEPPAAAQSLPPSPSQPVSFTIAQPTKSGPKLPFEGTNLR